MMLEFRNFKTGETMTVSTISVKHEHMKDSKAFSEAMDKAMHEAEMSVCAVVDARIKKDPEAEAKAQAAYAIAVVTLLSLAHAASDKGLYVSYEKPDFQEMVKSIENAICDKFEDASKEAKLKSAKKA